MARRSSRRTGTGRARQWGRAGLGVLVVLIIAWFGGLVAFASEIPDSVADTETETDAIVVLTGGSGRLETGFELLAERRAAKLFVSGVYRGVDVASLLQLSQRNPDELICCVSLGYAAESTSGNARETAAWIAEQGYTSLRLVTANYHMPRSILEFSHAMPDIRIIPHAVFPANFKSEHWWMWPGSASLVVGEYTKFLAAWVRHRVEAVIGTVGGKAET